MGQSIRDSIVNIKKELPSNVNLVAVSKFHPVEKIQEAYDAGHRIFGESRPQEFEAKVKELPSDIEWHFIGHLQRNKVKMVLPYAHLVESVDSVRILNRINSWAEDNDKIINVLLEVHVADEKTKFGFSRAEVMDIFDNHLDEYKNVNFCGLMAMATNTDDENHIREEFAAVRDFHKEISEKHPELCNFKELSIGMSGDYKIAIDYSSTLVRIGTKIFGVREY